MIRTSIETRNLNLARSFVSFELIRTCLINKAAVRRKPLTDQIIVRILKNLDLEAGFQHLLRIILVDLGDVEGESVVGYGLLGGGASTLSHGVVGVDKLDGVAVTIDLVANIAGEMSFVGHNDFRVLVDSDGAVGILDSLKILEGNPEELAILLRIDCRRHSSLEALLNLSRGIGCGVDDVDMEVLGAGVVRLLLINDKALAQCILELVRVLGIGSNVVRNSTGQLVVDVLANLGIAKVSPIIGRGISGLVRAVFENLLVDRGDAGLLGNDNGIAANNGKDRGGASVRLGRIRKTIRHEEIIAIAVKAMIFIRVRARPRLARPKLSHSGLRLNIFLHA